MAHFIEVNKLLGENVTVITRRECRSMEKRDKTWNWASLRKIFCDNLRSKGYDNITINGSYIVASNGLETVTFYFSAHSPQNKNYCVPLKLKNKVDYFAFYNNKTDVVYCVGYGIIREYCKNIKEAFYFYGYRNAPKMFIPDSWAQSQKINTMLLY